MNKQPTTPQGAKRTEPIVPVGHPEYRWSTGADVQSTWRKYGWLPREERQGIKSSEEK